MAMQELVDEVERSYGETQERMSDPAVYNDHREAVASGDESEMTNVQGDCYADLGDVLLLAGKPEEAAEALERYERKENLVMAERTRERLAALTPTP